MFGSDCGKDILSVIFTSLAEEFISSASSPAAGLEPLDALYILQLRALLIQELIQNLNDFMIPLDRWLWDEVGKSSRLLSVLGPLYDRFLPGQPMPREPPPVKASSLPLDLPGESLILDEEALFTGENSGAAISVAQRYAGPTQATTPLGGGACAVGVGWELATPLAQRQANNLLQEALEPANLSAASKAPGPGQEDEPSPAYCTEEAAARSLWRVLGARAEREAGARMRRKQSAVTRHLQATESHLVAVVAQLVERRIHRPNDPCDPAERTFHRRFRVSDEPLLLECGSTLRITRIQDGFLLGRHSGRVYITFSHLWFDSPGGLLSEESQTVVPFYTVSEMGTVSGKSGSSAGLSFIDQAGRRFLLSLSGGMGSAADFAERAGDLVLQIFLMFQDSRAKASNAETEGPASPTSRDGTSTAAGAVKQSPVDVDELEILHRVQRIAEMSAKNANLLAEFGGAKAHPTAGSSTRDAEQAAGNAPNGAVVTSVGADGGGAKGTGGSSGANGVGLMSNIEAFLSHAQDV